MIGMRPTVCAENSWLKGFICAMVRKGQSGTSSEAGLRDDIWAFPIGLAAWVLAPQWTIRVRVVRMSASDPASVEPIHERVAGMDVHRMEHVVTVLVEQEDGTLLKDTRKFGG